MNPKKYNPTLLKVFYWQYDTGRITEFDKRLFDLVTIADKTQKERLRHVYPLEVMWIDRLINSEDIEGFIDEHLGDNFFKNYFKRTH